MKTKKKSEQSKKQTQIKTTPKNSPTSLSSSLSLLKPKTRGDEKKKSPDSNVSTKSNNNNSNNNTKSQAKESLSDTQEKQAGVDNFLSRQAPRLSPRRLASKLNDAQQQQQNKLASNINTSGNQSNGNNSSSSNSSSTQKTITNNTSTTTIETPEGVRRMSSRRRKPSWRVTAMESDSSDQNATNDGKGSSTSSIQKERKNSSPTRSEKSASGGKKASQQHQQQQRKEDKIKLEEIQQKQIINTSTDSARTSPLIIITKSNNKATTDMNLTLTTNSSILTNGSLKITSVSPTKLKTEVTKSYNNNNTITTPTTISKNIIQKYTTIPEKVTPPIIIENTKIEVEEELKISLPSPSLPSSITSLPSSPSLKISISMVNGYIGNEQQQQQEKRKTDNQDSSSSSKLSNQQKSHHSEDFIVQAKRLKLANTLLPTTNIASTDTTITKVTTTNFNTTTASPVDTEEKRKETKTETVQVIPLIINEKTNSSSLKTNNNNNTTTTNITTTPRIQEIKKIIEQENSIELDNEDDDEEVIEVIQDTLTINNNNIDDNISYKNNSRTNVINNNIKKHFENISLNTTTNNLCCCNESSLNTNELRLNFRPSPKIPEPLVVVVNNEDGDVFREQNTKKILDKNNSSIPFEPFCQAIDLVDSQRLGCIRPATSNLTLYRVSRRKPFMLLCPYHVSRMKLHQCCPVCGYFCLQGGNILLCTRDVDINLHLRDGSNLSKYTSHLFHRTCAIEEMKNSSEILTDNNNDSSSEDKNNNNNCSTKHKTENQQQQESTNNDEFLDSKIECPHCRHSDGDINEISVRFQAAQLPVFLPERPDAIRKIAAATLPKTLNIFVDDLSLRYIGEKTANRLANAMSEAKLLVAEYPKLMSHPESFLKALLDGDISRVMAALLTGNVANMQFPSHNDESALHLAVRSRDICLIHGLLVCGSNPNVKDKSGRTPLMLTAQLNEPTLAKYLIAAGANKFEKDLHAMNVIHIAAMEGCHVFLKSILEHHPDFLKTVETNGLTPLMVAAKYNHHNVVNYLASHWSSEINIRALDSENNTALHWSTKCGALQAVSVLLQKLKDNSELINARNVHGQTPLHLAVTYCHDGCVLLLLVNGCDLSIKDENGKTPLDLCHDASNENTQQNRESDIQARKAIKGCIIQTSTLRSVLSLDSQEGKALAPYRIVSIDISNGKESHGPIQCVNSVDDEVLPEDFTYITASVFRNNALTPPLITSSKNLKCKCQSYAISSIGNNEVLKNKSQLVGTSCFEDCSCSKNGPFYDSNGRLLNILVNHFNSSQLPVINECNQLCKCDFRQCSNRVVQKGIKFELQVFKTEYKGWGVKTLCHIPRGSFICTYEGEIVSTIDSSKQYHNCKVSNEYFFELYNHCILIDSSKYGNVSRFLNSSCSPNLLPIRVLGVHGHEDERYATIAFFAIRDIEANEELCYDYGEKFWELKISEGFKCDCFSEVCRYSIEPDNEEMDLGNDDEVVLHLKA